MIKYLLFFVFSTLFADAEYATVVNEVKVAKGKPGLGLATVDAGVSFNVAPKAYHPHNSPLEIKSILIQGRKLADGSWKLYSVGKSCLTTVNIGEQLRIMGAINKKIHIFCKKSKVVK